MMGDVVRATPDSWVKAAAAFDESGSGAVGELSALLAETTDPAACGAAEGLATVDGAVAVMLTVFDSVMRSEVLSSLEEGFASESEAMRATAEGIRLMEEDATYLAGEVGR